MSEQTRAMRPLSDDEIDMCSGAGFLTDTVNDFADFAIDGVIIPAVRPARLIPEGALTGVSFFKSSATAAISDIGTVTGL